MEIEEVRERLRNPRDRSRGAFVRLRKALMAAKRRAVSEGRQARAKELWCLETVLFAQTCYADAFRQMKSGSYYEAWCALEQVEVALRALARHHPLSDYGLEWLVEYARRFQSIYPYKKFVSAGYRVTERRCGLCGAVLTPRTGCRHRKGEIYDGRMCFQVVTSAEVDHLAVVDGPVHKSCIIHLDYDFQLVKYVVDHLESPFDGWVYKWTRIRHPHARFAELSGDSPCPCESGTAYEDCCLMDPAGVLRPHFLVKFAVPPKQPMVIRYLSTHVPRDLRWAASAPDES